MIDQFFRKPHRREIKELQIVPVIDMFTTVIFFLLMSTSFIAMTKLSVPPTKVDSVPADSPIEPLAPKVVVKMQGPEQAQITLSWRGKSPGEFKEVAKVVGDDVNELLAKCSEVTAKFMEAYPGEKSIRLGFDSQTPYQWVIGAMDGVRKKITDIVLVSYEEG